MDPNWSDLPDVCLLLIFRKLPLALLFGTLSLVCQKWTRLIASILQTQNELVLMADSTRLYADIAKLHKEANPIGSEFLANALRNVDDSAWARELVSRRSIEFNHIRVPGVRGACALTDRFTTSLLNIFGSVTHLTVVLSWFRNEDAAVGELARIIGHYAPRLVSLKLDLYNSGYLIVFPGTLMPNRVRELFISLNQITQLDHLTLNLQFDLSALQPRDFAFLARVRSFASHQFAVGDYPDRLLLASLLEHATGGRCTEIDSDLHFQLNHMKELNPQLANKFRRICVVQELDTIKNMQRDLRQFADRFVSLTSLEIDGSNLSFNEISRCLSRLTALIHLNLFVRSQPPALAEYDDDDDDDDDDNDGDEEPEITPLPSVRYLTLEFTLPTHSDFTKLQLSGAFPNLQVLRNKTYHYICAECNTGTIDTDWSNETAVKRAKKEANVKIAICTSLIQQTYFRLIPSLRVLHYDPRVHEIVEKSGLPIGLFTDGGRSSPPAYVLEEDRDE